ncbi:MAG: glutamate racemase [Bacteroidetes bacterium HGW-Bacteroidetes-2]|jgi:glutamate racemase|nr:MAG: glutamate racemase [Bacteroidetes bacterium HGW-Bacteroidetes-2]
MKTNNPIGIFDSGVGGTSIWKEIHTLMPWEDTIYLSDSKNAPYGYKCQDEIKALSIKNTEKLISLGCKIIVVACNTATTNAIELLRATYQIPIIGIEPAIKPAALQSKTGKIGILATKGTLRSSLFSKTSELFTQNIEVTEIVGEGLVSLIENGKKNSAEMTELLTAYLRQMVEANIDYLVLGCSHYPYLIPQIKKILPEGIIIIDSGEAVALQTKTILANKNLLENKKRIPSLYFYSNSRLDVLKEILAPYKNKSEFSYLDF